MSDYIVKIIPADPYARISEPAAQEAVDYLKRSLPADSVTAVFHSAPAFIDCGSNLERISCPLCGAELEFDWWTQAMDEAHHQDFRDLSIQLPCCGGAGSLNDLCYDFPCGFARTEFQLLNPKESPSHQILSQIQTLIGGPIRVIHAHL